MKSLSLTAMALLWLCFHVSSQITQLSAELIAYHTDSVGAYNLAGMSTFRVYAEIPNPEQRLMSIIASPAPDGEIDLEEVFSYSACGTFDHPFGSWNAPQVLAQVINLAPALAYDSWITPGVEPGFDCSTLVYCNDPESYDDEDVSMSNFTMHHGGLGHAAFCNVGYPQEGKVLVAQFTTCGTVDFYACFNVAVSSDPADQETYCLSITVTPGCTDPLATNYNPLANLNNETCVYPIFGCTDPQACNFSADAEADDGSCLMPGCLSKSACNFDPQAACHEASTCTYQTTLEMTGETEVSLASNTVYQINEAPYDIILWEVYGGVLITNEPLYTAEVTWDFPGSGLVRVTVETNDECMAQTAEMVVTVSNASHLDDEPDLDFIVYPNPSNGIIHVDANHVIERVIVYDHLGRECLHRINDSPSTNLDLSAQPGGIYSLAIYAGRQWRFVRVRKR